jgi:NAD(P)-dependent dehydrogenase (short-subunit alcohol dehydrogenase family)
MLLMLIDKPVPAQVTMVKRNERRGSASRQHIDSIPGGGRGRPVDTKAITLDPALLRLVTEMNLFGTVYSCNSVAPIMKQQRFGKIITVSSVAGTAPSADGGYAHYGAAKAAIAHYTRYLAQDLGPYGITANWYRPRRDRDRAYHDGYRRLPIHGHRPELGG